MGANQIIDRIYQTRVVRDAAGNEYDLAAEVDPVEGNFLYQLISSNDSIVNTVEVGCAYGLSSLHICEALRNRRNASHTIIDPMQMSDWHGIGVAHLEQAGIDFFDLIPQPSEIALPELLSSRPEGFDLIFIDGWHTFDQTMLDLFYANRLVRVGGYIVIDDCQWRSVSAAVSYYKNYPAFERVSKPRVSAHSRKERIAKIVTMVFRPGLARMVLPMSLYGHYRRMCFPTVVAFKKVTEDNRSWTWFAGI